VLPKSPRRLIAFLRAINVGGHNLTMADLRRLFQGLGLKEVETFIASGNVIFHSAAKDIRALELMIEDRLGQSLGYEVTTFIRTEEELRAIAQHNPFKTPQLRAAQAFNVAFLSEPPGRAARKSIVGLTTEIDDFHVQGREVYWLCKAKQSDSKFNNARFEKVLKARATWRGMNTMRRLAAKYVLSS
jgi:uncharacterized protein (DUF1697 family)